MRSGWRANSGAPHLCRLRGSRRLVCIRLCSGWRLFGLCGTAARGLCALNAGRNGGEYYTPALLIRATVRVVKPQIGEHSAGGSAGFFCESFDFMKAKPGLTTKDKSMKLVPVLVFGTTKCARKRARAGFRTAGLSQREPAAP